MSAPAKIGFSKKIGLTVTQLVIFSDLDGTLLDHETYDFSPALPALTVLKAKSIPLVLASSKTSSELSAIRAAMGMEQWPAIVENGAGELPPHAESPTNKDTYERLRRALDRLPSALQGLFRGFGDMSDRDVADITGLPLNTAALAKQRAFTEPGLFNGSAEQKSRFVAELEQSGILAQQGGRFLTLSYGGTKADKIKSIAKRLQAETTIALGDAPNDVEMLLSANVSVIIRNDNAPEVRDIPGAIYSEQPGPTGWNTTVLALLKEYCSL
ncbi:MAG: HAD-IIB family hydrolase [Granulosicoccus sp.]|nr:HAD-IIB family hydrolase [Granulosicoccus sp.]